MDRLTRKSQSSEMVWFIDHDNNDLNLEPCEMSYSNNGKAIRKLAEYEDTGLTPQEIEQMKARMPLHQWAGESSEKMSIFGVPVSKIIELANADKQGRLVIYDEETMLAMAKANTKAEEDKLELLRIINKLAAKQSTVNVNI